MRIRTPHHVMLAIAVLVAACGRIGFGEADTTTGSADIDSTLPMRAAFFYPWFPSAWSQSGISPFTQYHPTLGYYSSTDDAVIDQQLTLAQRAHLGAFIGSWWGAGHHTDSALQHILPRAARSGSPNPGLKWAIYYENESLGNPSASTILSDLRYLDTSLFAQPNYLRIGGKPVVFVYADGSDGAGMAQRWRDAKAMFGGNVYVVLKVYAGYRSDPNQPDSWHQYAPAVAYDDQSPYSVTISPGFWKAGEATPRLARDSARFESDARRMLGSGAAWQLVTTWNEWGEGSSIEPATEFGQTYLDILGRVLPAPPGGTTDAGTPATDGGPATSDAGTAVDGGSGTSTVTFTSVADTYVKSDAPSTSYGTSTVLNVDGSPATVRTLVRFNVTGIPTGATVTSARLRLYVPTNPSVDGGHVKRVGGSWSESTTWSSAPPVGTAVADLTSPATAGSWIQATVTSAVAGNGTVDFYVVTSSSDGVGYSSREAASNRPRLVVDYTSGATTSCGDGACNGGETCSTCPGDCGVCPTTDAVLVGAGDIAGCSSSGDEATANLLDAIAGTIFTAGDNAYDNGTLTEYNTCFGPSWGRHKARIRPSLGNHEYNTSGAAGYFGYFGTAYGGGPSTGYYSYELGAWHIVVINSNCSQAGGCGAGSPQERWLRTDLAAHPTMCTAAYWHHPRFSSGEHGSQTFMQPIWQALYDYNADVVVNGHDHDYERFARQTPSGVRDDVRGIRQIVAGTGGKNHYAFPGTPIANSQIRNSDTFGVLKLTLHASSFDWELVPEAGRAFRDSGTDACH